MPSRAERKRTIKEFVREFFVRVNYVDIYGRNVGYDYEYILAQLRASFPEAKTSKRWLRMMAYELSGSGRMPMRRRSRRGLAESYAMTLLMRRADDAGLQYQSIRRALKMKFPEQAISTARLRRLEGRLRYLKFAVPSR